MPFGYWKDRNTFVQVEGMKLGEPVKAETQEKPIHVRVAEALGMEEVKLGGVPGLPSTVFFDALTQYVEGQCPRFDLDWGVTGPLVERFKITLREIYGWYAYSEFDIICGEVEWDERVEGPTPLLAICELILLLGKRGKLDA